MRRPGEIFCVQREEDSSYLGECVLGICGLIIRKEGGGRETLPHVEGPNPATGGVAYHRKWQAILTDWDKET